MFNASYLVTLILFTVVIINANDDNTIYNPRDLCVRLVTNHTALIQWVEPSILRSEIQGYTVYYTRNAEHPLREWSTVNIGNSPMVTIRNFELGQIYHFRIRVNSLGLDEDGPLSHIYDFKMIEKTRSCYDSARTSKNKSFNILRAAATSYTSVEVWWNFEYNPHEVIGFKIFYGINGSHNWFNKTVGLTNSVELFNLVEFAVYKIAIASITKLGLHYYSQETTVKVEPDEVPLTINVYDITSRSMVITWLPPNRLNPIKYKISYDAVKDFIDAEGIRQHYHLEKIEVFVDADTRSYELLNLMPYTNYNINVSAIPVDYSYRPSTKITAKTEIASPASIAKPDFYRIVNNQNVQLILPKASEENGPISYYYLIVVPENDGNILLPTDSYKTEHLLEYDLYSEEDTNAPYITAKFSSKIPYAFILGTGERGTFKNHKLNPYRTYRVFVRAVVITSHGNLFTDSPYSEPFSLNTIKNKSLWPSKPNIYN